MIMLTAGRLEPRHKTIADDLQASQEMLNRLGESLRDLDLRIARSRELVDETHDLLLRNAQPPRQAASLPALPLFLAGLLTS